MAMLQRIPPEQMMAARSLREDVVVSPHRPTLPQVNLLAVVWHRRWTIIICALLALGAAFLYVQRATPIYSASSEIYVQQTGPKIISEALTAPVDQQGYLFTQCELIRSTAVLSAAIQQPGMADVRTIKDVSNPVGALKSAVTAEVAKQGDLITISAESTNAQDAATIVNSVVMAYIDFQGERQKSTAAEVLKILQKEKDKHEAELTVEEAAMLDFKRANPALAFATDKGNVVTDRLAELTEALTRAQMETLDAKVASAEAEAIGDDPAKIRQYMYAQAAANRTSALPQMAADPVAGEIVSELRESVRKANTLRAQLGPANTAVVQADRDVAELRAELQQEEDGFQQQQAMSDQTTAAAYRAMLKGEYTRAQHRQDELQVEVDAQRKDVIDINTKSAEFAQLAANSERTKHVLDLLDSRIKEVNVSEDTGGLNINVLETAKAESSPIRPHKAKVVGIGLGGGMLLGFGVAMLQDLLDQRLRSADEIGSLLQMQVLGAIPHIEGDLNAAQRGQEIHLQPRSDVAEAYRTVRTAVFFNSTSNQGTSAKTLLITSPAPGDGKTTIASNFAIAAAQAGRRVLLIDADCRRPMQHKTFNLRDGDGLSTVLSGKVPLAKAVRRLSIEMLHVLPCGPLPANPAEMLNSQAFIDLIANASKHYDQIVLDSPPVMPLTDTRILASVADAVVLVVRAGKSTRRVGRHAVDALVSVGANLLGVVVNDVAVGHAGYSYYGGYSQYRYGYGGNGSGQRSSGQQQDGTNDSEGIVSVSEVMSAEQPAGATRVVKQS